MKVDEFKYLPRVTDGPFSAKTCQGCTFDPKRKIHNGTKTITKSHCLFFEVFILRKYKHLKCLPIIYLVFI